MPTLNDWLPWFLVADFLLQNHWMATGKATSSKVCAVHVAAYLLPFCLLGYLGAPWWPIVLIGAEHFLQDRFALHLRWMFFYRQSSFGSWPTGPLCVDQAMHIVFIAIILSATG